MACSAEERSFEFWFPVDIVKSSDGTPRSGRESQWRLGGIASDEQAEDLQGETVFIKGLDTSYLMERGVFNWDHGKEPGDIIGEIDRAERQDADTKLWVEGFLYQDVKKAQDTYNLIKSLKSSGSKRRLGMSLEGKVKERDGANGKLIKKAWIKAVALTYNPVNKGTFADFIKSLGKFEWSSCNNDCAKCAFCEESVEKANPVSLEPGGTEKCPLCGCEGHSKDKCPKVEKVDNETQGEAKMLAKAGKFHIRHKKGDQVGSVDIEAPDEATAKKIAKEKHGIEEEHIVLLHNDKEKSEGAGDSGGAGLEAGYDTPASSGGVSGSPLRLQSLEQDKKVTTYQKKDIAPKVKKKKIKKSNFIEIIMKKGYREQTANELWDLFAEGKVKGINLEKSSMNRSEAIGYLHDRGYSRRISAQLADMAILHKNAGTAFELALERALEKARTPKASKHQQDIVGETMHEFKHGQLHSGSKKGPIVTKRTQAIAIGLSQAGLSRK